MNNTKDVRKKIFPLEPIDAPRKKYFFKLAFAFAPHPHKVWKGGQDAIFVSKNIIIVADGVGGWAKEGIDSGWYARQLIQNVKELIQNEKELYFIERPEELAIRAVQNNQEKGSATLSIVTLHPESGIMQSYHIGDSIYGIYSRQNCYFMAEQQQKSFNVPFQVFGGHQNVIKSNDSSDSEEQTTVSDVFRGCYHQFTATQLKDKVIVLASDGLWDNVHNEDIRKEVFGSGTYVQSGKRLVRKIKEVGAMKEYDSPFYRKGMNQNQKVPKTGKVDDVSIIVASVQSTQQ